MTDDLETRDPHPVIPWLTPARRVWLYGVAVATAGLAVAYEVLTEARAATWVALVVAVIGNGVAARHVPR